MTTAAGVGPMDDPTTSQVTDTGPTPDQPTEDSRPPVYFDPAINKWVYRSYSLGNCERALTAFRHGVTPIDHPDWLMKAFEQGRVNEPVILDMLYHPSNGHPWEPAPLEGRQQLLEVPVGSECLIRGHTDDIAVHRESMRRGGTEMRVVEAKAFAISTWEKFQREGWSGFPYYAWQLSIYMHALGMLALFVVGLKDAEGVVRSLFLMEVDEPPVPMWQIKARVVRIHQSEGLGGVGCTFRQYPCQMLMIGDEAGCGGKRDEVPEFGKQVPKQQVVDWDLEKQLRASVQVEQLNQPAELMFEGKRLIAQGQGKLRQADELFGSWFKENVDWIGEPEITTSKWVVKIGTGDAVRDVWDVKPRHTNTTTSKGPE